MFEPIKNRYEFVLFFDVENGNPNGDPDAGNMPRIDAETGLGLVTDVCLKRKIRNYVDIVKNGIEGFDIYVREGSILNNQHMKAYSALDIKPESKKLPKNEEDARRVKAFMCKHFYDIRTFGAVMTTEVNCGQVRGPVQINFARSIDPIVQQEVTITRMAVTSVKDAEKKDREMGRKHIVPYALYRAEGYVSAHLAEKSGFTKEDLELLWQSLTNMFDHDRSAARGKMATRKLIIFEHETALGNASAHSLFDMVEVSRKDLIRPPRAYSDYKVTVNMAALPAGIKLMEK
ncbi:CRISPR-associated protein, Csd2 family [Desulforamulus reducens MI-1]|uniref:CRISPR-associated protein, Csd2 family n=1 Tax=Desulforamulus reducens (strain ATCC BAA-1160 / DSM 100696 / MI-1) TaxID=349161 RepID=A4J387_DESRM|nr:type I-C CRISPR-associated protein Cas7/Csd2 [Desulforamulus reducens]ABO49540.1 CRISPR-associated protein, Csd2 family [Desulforamulus reducens MI-1]